MRVIVDTSVWSLALRRVAPSKDAAVEKLASMIDDGQPIFILGVILLEILQGIKADEQRDKVRKFLEPFPLLELSRDDYVESARISCLCRSKGIQASTIDFLIAGAAVRNECALLTTDKDFTRIAQKAPLKLL